MFRRPARTVRKVYLHHSATDNPAHDNPAFIRRVHVEQNGWASIGYHFYIDKAGTRHECRSLELKPAAQKGHNNETIAICLGGHKSFTAEQRKSLTALCRQINQAYGAQVTFHGHSEVRNTECPAYPYRKWLSLTERGRMRRLSCWQRLFLT